MIGKKSNWIISFIACDTEKGFSLSLFKNEAKFSFLLEILKGKIDLTKKLSRKKELFLSRREGEYYSFLEILAKSSFIG